MSWKVDGNIVYPLDDLKPHVIDYDAPLACWCRPDELPDGIVVHHSMDGREKFEEGAKLT